MSTPGNFLPGLFSQAGRATAFEIESLQQQLNIPELQDDGGHASKASPASPKAEAKAAKKGATKSHDETSKSKTPAGELARAIQEKLSMNRAEDAAKAEKQNQALKKAQAEKQDTRSAVFKNENKDGNWASKFTGDYDVGSINHRNEQRPHIGQYQIKHNVVLDRPPAWDMNNRSKHEARQKPNKHADEMAFLTAIDPDDDDAVQALTARQRTMMKEALGLHAKKPKQVGMMSLNSERGALGKIGRMHVNGNEVSCAEHSDLLEQDIKGYHKLRYPKWDMDAVTARSPLIKAEDKGEPGKYEYSLDCVKETPKVGMTFDKALPRSVFVGNLGYSAPPAVLHPEEKRTRGMLPDRSRGKDNVRHRVTHVNDFDRELARPPLPVSQGKPNHDENDPVACAIVYEREMSYDADTADRAVTHRRDSCPRYDRMIGRGKEAVQGSRALSDDLGVRGSVGLGFTETLSQVEHSVERREARAADGTKENPNVGPKLSNTTQHVHNPSTNAQLRGAPIVRGFGHNTKPAPLKRAEHPIMANAFKRSPSLPGFESRAGFGGVRISMGARSSSAIAGWAPDELERVAI